MTRLQNELSWSNSRHETLLACPRRYFFHYYRSWGGWEKDADPTCREAYRLKLVNSRAGWVGTVVHRAIAIALHGARQGRPLDDTDAFVEEVLGWMRQDYADSRDDLARRTGSFKQHVRFLEHERPHDPASPRWRQQWKDSADAAASGLRWFFASRWWASLRDLPESKWLHLDDPASTSPSSFRLDGVTVYAVPDCAFLDGEVPTLVDWKTGRAGKAATPQQLAGYALFLQDRGVPLERLRAFEVNVAVGLEREHAIGPEALDAFRARFQAGLARMRGLLADPAANVPQPEGEFAFTEDERECRWCVFASICPRVTAPF